MNPSQNAASQVQARLESARRELLDLGLRNPLLNYRTLRSRGVEVTGEIPAFVFQRLARERRAMRFLAVKEDQGNPPPVSAEAQADAYLQTALTDDALQKRLLTTYHAARGFVEEQGVNILFLALGMLEWYESERSEDVLRAPLLLVPVELARSSARERFKLQYTDEEIGANLSLSAKLKVDFGLELPPLPEPEDLDVDSYFEEIAKAISGQVRWRVDRTSIVLGFFSFGKFLMYRDLDVELWPVELAPARHPVLSALLGEGFRQPSSPFPEDSRLDTLPGLPETRPVVDADSTQTLAIVDALSGRNLVIQGPPGTGKSQTIANLIAEALGLGRKVLFVSEKMAALEVVKRRLDTVGLGDACLELHSNRANKKALLAELARTLDCGRPRVGADDADQDSWRAAREQLNGYCAAVNEPIAGSGISPHHAFGELLRLQRQHGESDWPAMDLPGQTGWTVAMFQQRFTRVRDLEARLRTVGAPREHPFRSARLAAFSPVEKLSMRGTLEAARDATRNLVEVSRTLADRLGVRAAERASDCDFLADASGLALKIPDMSRVSWQDPAWYGNAAEIGGVIEAGTKLRDLHARYDSILKPAAWTEDVTVARRDLERYGRKWWRILSSAYRSAAGRVVDLCAAAPPATFAARIELLQNIEEAGRLSRLLGNPEKSNLFGDRWRGEQSDWDELKCIFDWLREVHARIARGALPGSFLAAAVQSKREQIESDAERMAAARVEHAKRLAEVVSSIALDESARFGGPTIAAPFADQLQAVAGWLHALDQLPAWTAYQQAARGCEQDGLAAVVAVAEEWPGAVNRLSEAFRSQWLAALVKHAYQTRPVLAQFDGNSQAEVVSRFRQLDRALQSHNRARLALQHWEKLPQLGTGGQLGVLTHEFQKKARHLPIRQLMLKAGRVIQDIKPVFMMSPMSIATFLPPESATFDLVVFDEASQVRPADALGAILRGRQAVVVGDSRQLPPTDFFGSVVQADEDADGGTADVESVLGLFAAQQAPSRMLRWHYRSRHESLIAVSNHRFYEDRLVIFPSPDRARDQLGLAFRHLPHTAYDRGKTRTNPGEAKAVAQEVIAFARDQLQKPSAARYTLGVAAFSLAQMQAILDQLEILRRQNHECEEFFSTAAVEPFFVKNLESVQGDERDVIFISVGYGRTAEGYVAMDFGPLNQEGGERRLNVLITRARLRCIVFTNLTGDDIDLNRTDSAGVSALKAFLTYAESGRLDIPVVSGREEDSPFEHEVLEAIAAAGYTVQSQVGSAGFYIDMAVVDPARPGRYLMGIECDGAAYHSARSARDRDRLRQQVLEALGWRIHRIWSTDWFGNPKREVARAIAAIEAAKTTPATARPAVIESPIEREESAPPGKRRSAPPYELAHLRIGPVENGLHSLPAGRLASLIVEVVHTESPVHIDEVYRRIADAAEVSRIGPRIRAALDQASESALGEKRVVRKGDFLWRPGQNEATPRDRSALEPEDRRIELIAPEEIEQAIHKVLLDSYGMALSEVAPAVSDLLGFSRAGEALRESVELMVNRLIAGGALQEQGGALRVNQTGDRRESM